MGESSIKNKVECYKNSFKEERVVREGGGTIDCRRYSLAMERWNERRYVTANSSCPGNQSQSQATTLNNWKKRKQAMSVAISVFVCPF